MKTLDLDFIARVKLADILGNATGPLAKISALQSVYKKVQLTEQDTDVQRIDLGGGRVTVTAPLGTCGKRVAIEDSEAVAVLTELEAWTGYQIGDLDWLELLKSQLKPSTTIRKKEK